MVDRRWGVGRRRVITALDRWMTSRALPVPRRQSARCQLALDTYVRLGLLEGNVSGVAGFFSFVVFFFPLGVSGRGDTF